MKILGENQRLKFYENPIKFYENPSFREELVVQKEELVSRPLNNFIIMNIRRFVVGRASLNDLFAVRDTGSETR